MNSRSQVLTRAPRWRQVHHGNIPGTHPPREIASWLLEPGSLTARLRQQFGAGFRVVLLRQSWQRPFIEESCLLRLAPGQRCIVREVSLQDGETPLILARSIIPAKTLHGADRRLANLGTQPLGHILFSDPRLRKLQLEVTRIGCTAAVGDSDRSTQASRLNGPPRTLAGGKPSGLITGQEGHCGRVWGRRSLYSLGSGHHLLVAEFFLPGLYKF